MSGRCADRDELDIEAADESAGPFRTDRIALEEAEHPEALDPADVEAHGRRARALAARQEHIGPERLVTRLRLAPGHAKATGTTSV